MALDRALGSNFPHHSLSAPADNYFVLGDNRDNSIDSRVGPDQGGVGFVPATKAIGRADFFLVSHHAIQLFKPVR